MVQEFLEKLTFMWLINSPSFTETKSALPRSQKPTLMQVNMTICIPHSTENSFFLHCKEMKVNSSYYVRIQGFINMRSVK